MQVEQSILHARDRHRSLQGRDGFLVTPGSGERIPLAQQRNEHALALKSAVLFRQSQRLRVSGFGSCVLTCVEESVPQSGQRIFEPERIGIGARSGCVDSGERCFDVDARARTSRGRGKFSLRRNVLNARGRGGADREADCNRRYGGSKWVWMRTVHGQRGIF